MKLITFTVPCYNSEDYMSNCINSLLKAGKDAEIIIVDDGSKDSTGEIADKFAEDYPEIVRVIHQENGGHGEGVNQGIRNANGIFFKVVDSDDRVDAEALEKVMQKLRQVTEDNITLDALFTNYVYEHLNDEKTHVVKYKEYFPVDAFFSWDRVGKFGLSDYILMHSVIYRTQLLKECKIELPKHTFYVDNIFVYQPLPFVKNMYYMDVDFYRYFTGREDQSVNEKVMIKNIDQQIKITKLMTDMYDLGEVIKLHEHLGKYMLHYLSMMYAISFMFLTIDGTKESFEKIDDLKAYLKEHMPSCYRKIMYGSIAGFVNISEHGRGAVVQGYKLLRKIYKFN